MKQHTVSEGFLEEISYQSQEAEERVKDVLLQIKESGCPSEELVAEIDAIEQGRFKNPLRSETSS